MRVFSLFTLDNALVLVSMTDNLIKTRPVHKNKDYEFSVMTLDSRFERS